MSRRNLKQKELQEIKLLLNETIENLNCTTNQQLEEINSFRSSLAFTEDLIRSINEELSVLNTEILELQAKAFDNSAKEAANTILKYCSVCNINLKKELNHVQQ